MIHGIDTDFLVALEIRDHEFHGAADALLEGVLDEGHDLAVAPQTLAEFIHIVTDGRRMKEPLSCTEAVGRAEFWWHAREVVRVFPDERSADSFLTWLREHRIGRKRLLDTLLAATYAARGIRRVITNNVDDFRVFGCFDLISYRLTEPPDDG